LTFVPKPLLHLKWIPESAEEAGTLWYVVLTARMAEMSMPAALIDMVSLAVLVAHVALACLDKHHSCVLLTHNANMPAAHSCLLQGADTVYSTDCW